MNYKKVKLGDISTVSSSKRIFARQYVTSGVPFYRQKEILDKKDKKEITEPLYISQDTYNDIKKRFGVPQKGDLLITAVGVTLGIPYIVEDELFYFKDGNLIWLKDFDKDINSRYLYYWITSDNGQKLMWSRTIGSAQPALTIDIVKQIEISLPNYEKQCKIVNILSVYDNLLENNGKQIKLLEEAAQRLYKEWFVDLRFPDYEVVEVINNLPSGWKVGKLEDIALFKRGKTITKSQVHEGNVPVVAGGLAPAYYHNKANTVAPVITVSGSGANAGFARLYNVDVFASDCSFADSLSTPYLFFVYCFIKGNKAHLDSLQKGAAQPHVYAKDINSLNLLIPPENILDLFCKTVTPYFNKIKALQKQIELISEARDRLLPKLMSGEIEV